MKKESMNIYMAALGEKAEGIGYTSLHYTLEGAVKQAKKWISESYFEWKELPAQGSDIRYWEGGCDYIEIKERKVQN